MITSEKLWFYDVFRDYWSGTLVENGLEETSEEHAQNLGFFTRRRILIFWILSKTCSLLSCLIFQVNCLKCSYSYFVILNHHWRNRKPKTNCIFRSFKNNNFVRLWLLRIKRFRLQNIELKILNIINSFMTEVPIIQKPVHWFALDSLHLHSTQWTRFCIIVTSVTKELMILSLLNSDNKQKLPLTLKYLMSSKRSYILEKTCTWKYVWPFSVQQARKG